MCKGDMEDRLTTFMVDLGNCIVIVKNVPSHVCKQCGEVSYYNKETLQFLVNLSNLVLTY